MDLQRSVMGVMLVVLVSSTGFALAQGRGHGMGMRDGMGHERGAERQMQPLMSQMGGLMQQMAERIKAGPLTPDQTLQLSTMLEHLATMVTKLSGGMLGSDPTTQLEGMRARMTEMQRALVALMVMPPPVVQTPPPEKP